MSEPFIFPKIDRLYIVQEGDDLKRVSVKAYGTSDYTSNLQASNPVLSTRRKDSQGLPELIEGETLNIPTVKNRRGIAEVRNDRPLGNKQTDDFTLVIEDREIPLVSGKLIRTVDTVSDGFSGTIAWFPGLDRKLDELLLPFRYPKIKVYLGNELQLTGYLYGVNPVTDSGGTKKNLSGSSLTTEMIDNNIRPPYERNNMTLKQISDSVLKQIGVKSVFEVSPGGRFERVTAQPQDKIFDHLSDLASQRGILLSNTVKGEVLYYQPGSGENVGTLEEGRPPVLSWSANYDGRRRFSAYKAIGQSPGADAQTAIARDDNVPLSRLFTFTANETTPGDIQKAANWKRTKMLADILTTSLPVTTWYSPSGKLWAPDQIITIISDTLSLPRPGINMLIKSVEFIFQSSGIQAILSIVPPAVYTGKALTDPWSVKGSRSDLLTINRGGF
ncbi:hypothetical protein AMJ80_02365 [bacterium SM23_31]|nr:MAG: hypothetical protein AMJ80_02365 [bacterium SM23_31]